MSSLRHTQNVLNKLFFVHMCTSITREKYVFKNKVHGEEIKSSESRGENLAKKTIFCDTNCYANTCGDVYRILI